MSILSAQVDKLRELATRCDELQVGAVKAVTMPSDMGSILHEAADTILSLRDKAQELQAENARLRERSAKTLEVGTRWMAKAARFESENTKLRELVRQMHTCLTRPKAYTGASQPYLVATECPHFTQGVCDYNSCGFERRMRELGVEVE